MVAVGQLLVSRRDVYRKRLVDDGAGGRVTTWEYVATVPCRVSQPRPTERAIAMQMGAEAPTPVYCAPDADVQRGDELRDPDTGQRLRVVATVRPSVAVYLRADCHQVEAEGGM